MGSGKRKAIFRKNCVKNVTSATMLLIVYLTMM